MMHVSAQLSCSLEKCNFKGQHGIMTHLPKWLKLKRWRISSVDKDVEQLELSCTTSGSLKQPGHFGSFWSDLLKLNGHIFYVTVILLSGECQQNAPSVHQKTCTECLWLDRTLEGTGSFTPFPRSQHREHEQGEAEQKEGRTRKDKGSQISASSTGLWGHATTLHIQQIRLDRKRSHR